MSGDAIAEVLEQERRRGQALVARDEATLRALFADDLVHIHSTGNLNNKSELMHHVMHVLLFLSVERSELKVAVHGDVAVMSGRMNAQMRRFDKPEATATESWVTQVWVRRGAAWVQTHFQATRAAAAAARPSS
jgi:ketosteroid isomerase-like protein